MEDTIYNLYVEGIITLAQLCELQDLSKTVEEFKSKPKSK